MPRSLLALIAVLAVAAPAAAQAPKPEAKVGPVSFNAWRFPGKLPAPGEDDDGPLAPRSTAVSTTLPPLVLQSSYVGRKAAEPTMGVDRMGNAFYAASDFDGTGGTTARTEVYRSTDGAVTWQEKSPNAGGAVDYPPTTLDPYVYTDQRTDRTYSIDLEGLAGSFLAYTDDQGETWAASAMSAPGANDHQTFFTGPPPVENPLLVPSLNDWPTIAYYCVNALSHVGCSLSNDGGMTFQELPSQPYVGCVGCQTGHGVVDSEGRVFLPRGGVPGTGETGPAQIAISENAGQSWETVDVGAGVIPDSRHTAVAVDSEDNVYYVWYDSTFQLPWLSVSKDHGRSWGAPLMVAPPGVADANFPMVAAGEPGKVAISFPGSSVDDPADASRPWHAWVVVTNNALDEAPVFHAAIGDDGKDPLHRGTCNNRCAGMFDFIDLQVSPKDGTVFGTFTDTCTAANKCTTLREAKLATDAQGVAVRTISGPRLIDGPTAPGALAPVAAGPAGPGGPTPSAPAAADRVKPRVLKLKVSRRTVSWKLSERASARLQVKRGKKTVASFQTGRPGLTGSFRLKGLKRGRYRLTFGVTDPAGNRSRPVKRTLRLR